MFNIITRYFFVILSAVYTCYKLHAKTNSTKINVFLLLSIVIESFVISLFFKNDATIRIFLMFIITYLIIMLTFHSTIKYTFAIVSLAFGLSYIYLIAASLITSFVFISVYKTATVLPYAYTNIPTGLIQFLFLIFCFKSKRFQKGISSILKNNKDIIGTTVSIIFITSIALISTNRYSFLPNIRTFINLVLVCFSYLSLFYWRHRITQTYREKLRQANEKSMLDEINEHKLTIEKLKADNKRLASIVHADNKLVPAMLAAVTNHLENCDHLSMEELTTRGKEMSEQLRSMAKDRQGILDSQHNETAALPKSGLHTVDGMLSFMKARAEENHIAYKVTFANTIKDTALNALSEEDLLRLLGDLIDNAIIAVNHSEKEKAILIHLGILQDKFLVEISDSGIPFSIETYQRFGNEQYTTHKDSGGSGIGLMDIWKIKKKYKASLHIYEFPEEHGNYTKKISFVFDRKNHFLLQTNRYKEITRELTRGDLYVFPYQSE